MDRLLRRLLVSLPMLALILVLLAAPRGSATLAAPAVAGDPDGSFGSGGKIVYQTSDYTSIYRDAFAVLADGKVIMAEDWDGVQLQRYDQHGQLDPGFGGDGIVELDLTGGLPVALNVAPQSDGKLIVVFGKLIDDTHMQLSALWSVILTSTARPPMP